MNEKWRAWDHNKAIRPFIGLRCLSLSFLASITSAIFWGGLVLLGLQSHIFIGTVFLLVGRRLKISGSVDVDACGGGWCHFRGGLELSNCTACHILVETKWQLSFPFFNRNVCRLNSEIHGSHIIHSVQKRTNF